MSMSRIAFVLLVLFVAASVHAQYLPGTWRFSDGQEFPGASGRLETEDNSSGMPTVNLYYDFSDGGAYVAAYCDLEEPTVLGLVHFRMNKPPETTITVRVVDATGQTFQKSFYYDLTGERELAFNMQGWTGYWGGADDGVLQQPIHTIGILVEKRGMEEETGMVTFSGFENQQMEASEDIKSSVQSNQGDSEYLVTDFGEGCVLARSLGEAFHDGHWHIDFGGAKQASMNGSLSLFNRPSSLTIRARASAPGAQLTVHIGAHFQGFKRVVGIFDGTEQTFTFTLPPEGWEAYGAAHTTLHYPLRITCIAVEQHECKAEQIDIALEGITCETAYDHARAVTLMSTLQETGGSEDTRNFLVSCSGWNLLDVPLSGVLNLEVKNWDGKVIHTAEMPMTFPGDGMREQIEQKFEVPRPLRYVETIFRFSCSGQQDVEALSTYTASLTEKEHEEVLPTPVSGLQPASPWGMGVYLYRNAHNEAGYAEMDRVAALAAEAGVKWSREEFCYSSIETAPRVYDFSFYDRLVESAHRHGISVYGLLAYWSSFVKPYTEEGIDAYCDFTRATVRHFKGRIRHWEIYNEPNIFFWNGPKELYPVLLKRCYEIIKEEDPDAEVLAISTAGIDVGFIKQVLEAEAPFDALTVHPYRSQFVERNFIRELERVSKLVDGRPVWITEMGWSTQINGGKSEREQAQLLARAYLSAVAAGVRSMGWYDFRNDGTDPFYNEANFGVLRRDLTPKAAYRALATVCRTMAISEGDYPELLKSDDAGNGIYALSSGKNTAIWAPHADMEVCFASDKPVPLIYNLMGEPVDFAKDESLMAASLQGDKHNLMISLPKGDPVFVVGSNISVIRADRKASEQEAMLLF